MNEVLNALLFVLMGLEVLVLRIPGHTVLPDCVAIGVVLVARLVSVWLPTAWLAAIFSPPTTAWPCSPGAGCGVACRWRCT